MIAHRILSLRSLRRLRFAADRRGVSAVEFALLLPLMLTMYFGNFVVSEAIIVDRQVTLMASTGAEITSQYSQVSMNDLTNIINAAATVLNGGQTPQPFPIAVERQEQQAYETAQPHGMTQPAANDAGLA